MILKEGGGRIEDTVLFGKYRLCRILGKGRSGTVFLAVHLGLEEYRAVKRVPKCFLDYEKFRKEALLLKELHHPGIPIVYDLEEDLEYSYLIEEYLEGESLYALVNRQGHLSRSMMIRYGIQICRIVNYLHSAGTIPILYLDLQPKNLLLCHEILKLVDFDQAMYLSDANISQKRYGTIGCAAPEQFTTEPLDRRTDIYAIGVILYYLGTGSYPQGSQSVEGHGWGKELETVLSSCLENQREKRFETAEEVLDRLESLQHVGTGVFTQKQSSSLVIALSGSKTGVGTTHLAIGLSVYLKNQGFPNVYEENNPSGAAAELGIYYHVLRDRFGLMQADGFVWKPHYGACVRLEENPYEIHILDFGADYTSAMEACPDGLLLICGGKPWEVAAAERATGLLTDQAALRLVYNGVLPGTPVKAPHGIRPALCLKAPYFANPFQENADTKTFYRAVVESLGLEPGGTQKRRSLKKWLRNIIRTITGS